MNRLSKDQRTQIIGSLVEGNSLRATARMCNVAFNTVLKLLPEIGRSSMCRLSGQDATQSHLQANPVRQCHFFTDMRISYLQLRASEVPSLRSIS